VADRLTPALRYVGFLLVVLTAVTAALHWRWVRRATPDTFIADRRPLPCCDAAMMARIGRLDPPRTGSFQVTPLEKRPGTVRIGCFGDSFTAGLEVADGLDFPAELARGLRAHGAGHVEVVNFGNSGFGFHQMHMMAELVAPRFGVEAAVYAPMLDYWWARDGTFAQWEAPTKTLGVHGRYVLDGDGVRLVDPIGTTEAAQFQGYTRLVPPFRYLRYDVRPPAFLLAWLPAGRTLANPFFYGWGGSADEVRETYRRLLRRQLDLVPSAVLDPMGGVAELAGESPAGRRFVLRVSVPDRFPYLAPQNHWSPWGNRLIADHALRAFAVEATDDVDVIETSVDAGSARDAAGVRPLPEHDAAEVFLADRPAGGLYRYEPAVWETPRAARFPAGTRAVVAIAAPRQPLVDALFVALSVFPVPGDALTAEDEETGVRTALDARLDWLADGVARLDLCAGPVLAGIAGGPVAARCIVPVPWDPRVPGRPLVIRVGEQRLVTIDAGPFGAVLLPTPSFKLRAHGNLSAEPAALPERGRMALLLSDDGRPVAHVPLGGFQRTRRPLPRDVRPLRVPLGAAGN
jgi:hypothetical protein